MIIILDASAAVEIVLQREKSKRLLSNIEEADWIMAPRLFISEVSNTFWKYYKLANLSMEQCETGIEYSINLPDEYSDDRTLYREAFSLGCRISRPVYDMFYLVLARRNNGCLMTLDKSLAADAVNNSVKSLS